MPLRSYKPTSPGRRGMTRSTFEEITSTEPYKPLLEPMKRGSGRNNQGRLTVRHRGGGEKQNYRRIDFKRDKHGVPARIATVEYDPNRSARIGLLHYRDGEKRYMLLPHGLRVGDVVVAGVGAEARVGNALPISHIPLGTTIHNIELIPGKGGQIVRSAGTAAQLLAKEGEYAQIRLPSGEVRRISIRCITGGPATFGMDMVDAMGWLHHGGGLELYQEFYRDQLKLNVIVFPILPSGPQAFGWFNRPIQSLADMKGMKCRQTGIAGEIWQALGFTVVNMPGGEIIPAAQRGVIDCAEWVGGVEDMRLGFQNVWKYHYSPGVHESVTIGEVVFNLDVWNSLKPQEQEWIKSAANEAFLIWWTKWQKQNAEALKELQEKHGVQVLQTPAEILREFLKGWDKLVADESAKSPFFKKVIDSQKAYAAIVVPMKRAYFPPYSFLANYYFPPQRR